MENDRIGARRVLAEYSRERKTNRSIGNVNATPKGCMGDTVYALRVPWVSQVHELSLPWEKRVQDNTHTGMPFPRPS